MITRYPQFLTRYPHCGHRPALLIDEERGILVRRIDRWRELVRREVRR